MARTAADVLIDKLHAGAWMSFSACPATASTASWKRCASARTRSASSTCAMKNPRRLWHARYAKYTGKLGVCLATSGPGGIHLLNGLYDAKLDGQPVLAITGMQFHDLIDTHTQQDVELDKLFMDVAVYNARVMGPAHVENVADLACRTALELPRRRAHHLPGGYAGAWSADGTRSKRNVPHHTSDVVRASARPACRWTICAGPPTS